MSEMTFLGGFLYTIIPFGQLWTRIYDYNGSVDMWWFFIPLFMIPPFQFIPILFIILGYIKKGKNNKAEQAYDNYIWIPIITKFLMQIVGGMIIQDSYFYFIIEAVVIISIIITKYLHSTYICKVAKKEIDFSTVKLMGVRFVTTVIEAIFENSIGGLSNLIFSMTYDTLLPVLPDILTSVFWTFGYIYIYVIQNMFAEEDIDNHCNPSELTISNAIKFGVGFILSVIACVISFIPGDADEDLEFMNRND
jgi:hypothetical protein